jgi:FAD/FMN-containing dehydrogenase
VGLADAPRLLPALRERVLQLGLSRFLLDGAPVAVVKRNGRLPLFPAPDSSDDAVIIALRPELPGDQGQEVVPGLEALADWILEEGGRLYLMSVEGSHPDFLERQFGASAAPTLRALKRETDPQHRLNPWRPLSVRHLS